MTGAKLFEMKTYLKGSITILENSLLNIVDAKARIKTYMQEGISRSKRDGGFLVIEHFPPHVIKRVELNWVGNQEESE